MKKTLLCSLLFASLCICSCSEDDFARSELTGTWVESYSDPYFIMDGSVKYTFNSDNTYTWAIDNFLENTPTQIGKDSYTFDTDNRKLILNSSTQSGPHSTTYDIVKLTYKELSLQKEGTTYSRGTLGSDYRHFVKE